MTKKVLMLASVASMIDQFNMPNIKLLIILFSGKTINYYGQYRRNICYNK